MKDGKPLVLYVDDDPDFLDSVRAVLEANDYAMVDAATAEEGIKVFKQNDVDFVIVDLMMEEVDAGTNLVKDLKIAGCECPIYMLSSVGDALNLNTDIHELGLDGVLQKPLDFDRLLGILKSKLGQ
jgi:DNA-binding response OmpR family regulator